MAGDRPEVLSPEEWGRLEAAKAPPLSPERFLELSALLGLRVSVPAPERAA